MIESKLTEHSPDPSGELSPGADEFPDLSRTPVEMTRYFTGIDLESEYLKNLLARTVGRILHSGFRNDVRFGSVVEGETIAGGIAEVTGDHCIRINSRQLRRYEDIVAMALLAHELAHDHLGHFKIWKNNLEQEYSADLLAKAWGFNVERFRNTFGPPRLNSRLQQIAVIN